MSDPATSGGKGRREVWLFVLQRLSAMILAPLVIIHLVTMIYAIQDGLTAAEILERKTTMPGGPRQELASACGPRR